MTDFPTVLAAGQRIPLDAYEADPVRFAGALERARNEHGHAMCLCTAPPPPLVIRRRAAPEGDWYVLATWPNHGTAHAPGCRFHHSEQDYADARAQRMAAAQVGVDGFSIKPDFSLERRLVAGEVAPRSPGVAVPRGPTTQRSTMGLLGLLEFLWCQADLHRSDGGARRLWGEVQERLVRAAAHGRLGAQPLADHLYVIPPFVVDRKEQLVAQWEAVNQRFARRSESVPMFLMLGEIKSAALAGRAVATELRHHRYGLFMSPDLAAALAQRYPSAEARLSESTQAGRVVGLFLVEISKRGKLWVNDAALMLVSGNYLPADSSHEARLADALVEARRDFVKPMWAQPGQPLPDFLLQDTRPETALEVWGMGTDDYLARKREKLALYASAGTPVWQWNPTKERQMPVLPVAARR